MELSMNHFSGKIPEFLGSFEYLEYLNLSASGFVDGVVPHHLGNLSRLQYLDLRHIFLVNDHHTSPSYIFLSAPSVDDLGWVSSLLLLRYLDLSAINIGKNIDWFHPVNMFPSLRTLNLAHSDVNFPCVKFVNFTSIISLDLSLNGINSTIPVWLSNLTGLMHLNLNSNHLHGKIPYFIGMFTFLASIDLSYNSFATTIPDLLCNLSSLVRLDLSGSMLSGPIPTSLGLLSRLEDLYLHLNQLTGNIPMSIGQLSKLKDLDLHNNVGTNLVITQKLEGAKCFSLFYLGFLILV
ncbi:putative non-specific serine/threonine protein kinase [Helianthus annuus]|nr:putative non-specific serine/threonine protein kinase [Helianthus annuus]KAJ0828478.1 putative non-specific serine/threonine protein kinase [Helianthus annuus]